MIAAFMPIRHGSKSIYHKNIRDIAGKPLWRWAADAVCECPLINDFYIMIDNYLYFNLIKEYSNREKFHIVEVEEMDDDCMQESVILNFLTSHTRDHRNEIRDTDNIDHIILLQATSPFTTSADLTGGITKYFDGGYDSLLSVSRQKKFIWEEIDGEGYALNFDPQKRPRRQWNEGVLVENGSFFITSKEAFLKSHCRISGKIGLYEMPEIAYHEVDEPSDWLIVEALLKHLH